MGAAMDHMPRLWVSSMLGDSNISWCNRDVAVGALTTQQGAGPAEQHAGAGGVPVPQAAQSLVERADERRARGLQELTWLLNDAGALTEPSQAGQLPHTPAAAGCNLSWSIDAVPFLSSLQQQSRHDQSDMLS